MNVVLEKSPLLRSLAHQQSLVEKRSTVPILSHILMTIPEDQTSLISLIGTDLEMTLEENIPAQVKQSGSVALPVHMLYDIVRKLDDAPIELYLNEDKTLSLACGPSKFIIPTLPVNAFPKMSQPEAACEFIFSADDLRRLIDQTRFAMSTEEARHYLNGIYLHQKDGDLRAVATDAHRLALSWLPVSNPAQDMPGVIVSRKTITEVRKLIEGVEGTIKVHLSPHQIIFPVNDAILYSRLIEGQFPDYQRAIPQANGPALIVETQPFSEAVDRVSMISSHDKNRFIKISLSSQSLTFSANNLDGGFACEEMAVTYEGESIEMCFNARYILDVTQQIKGDHFRLYLNHPTIPALLQDTQYEQALYVLMPMRGVEVLNKKEKASPAPMLHHKAAQADYR